MALNDVDPVDAGENQRHQTSDYVRKPTGSGPGGFFQTTFFSLIGIIGLAVGGDLLLKDPMHWFVR